MKKTKKINNLPLNVDVTKEAITFAKTSTFDSKNEIIRHIRENFRPTIENVNGRFVAKIYKGLPTATLAAIKRDGKVYIGWAKRNTGTTANRPTEDTPYSKKDGRETAIMRALSDAIIVNKDGALTSKNGRPLPSKVAKEFNTFVEKAKRSFKTTKVENIVEK